jgi:hypothetical protein
MLFRNDRSIYGDRTEIRERIRMHIDVLACARRSVVCDRA